MPGGGASSNFALTALSCAVIASRVNSRLSGSAMPQAAAPQIAAMAAGEVGSSIATASSLPMPCARKKISAALIAPIRRS